MIQYSRQNFAHTLEIALDLLKILKVSSQAKNPKTALVLSQATRWG
jgi:hypothetical protein